MRQLQDPLLQYFNSHPHEEDDGISTKRTKGSSISIHILTKRMTVNISILNQSIRISIHILTKRMTQTFDIKSLFITISIHILTKRMTADKSALSSSSLYFNSHPHEEDDAAPHDLQIEPCNISIHILTKRMTTQKGVRNVRERNFNSHPHEEDDKSWCYPHSYTHISIHILTKRMTAILNKNNLFKIAYYINNKHFISIVDIFFHFHIYF